MDYFQKQLLDLFFVKHQLERRDKVQVLKPKKK